MDQEMPSKFQLFSFPSHVIKQQPGQLLHTKYFRELVLVQNTKQLANMNKMLKTYVGLPLLCLKHLAYDVQMLSTVDLV